MIGVEPATPFFTYAVEREQTEPLGITYIQQDLSRFTTYQATFDTVVAKMVFMDIPEYQAVVHNCILALQHGGRFIFSLLHPCFDEIDSLQFEKGYRAKGYIRVDEYFDEFVTKETWGYSFHRPLSTYLNFIIEHGCTIRKVIEPKLTQEGVAILHCDQRRHSLGGSWPNTALLRNLPGSSDEECPLAGMGGRSGRHLHGKKCG